MLWRLPGHLRGEPEYVTTPLWGKKRFLGQRRVRAKARLGGSRPPGELVQRGKLGPNELAAPSVGPILGLHKVPELGCPNGWLKSTVEAVGAVLVGRAGPLARAPTPHSLGRRPVAKAIVQSSNALEDLG